MTLLVRLWRWLVSLLRGLKTDPSGAFAVRLGQAILAFNTSRAAFVPGPIFSNPIKGVLLHELTAEEASTVAAALMRHLALDVEFCMKAAVIGSESAFDPNAENGNLGPEESNTANDPLGYDVGLCQFKLRYVDADALKARAIALNLDLALPLFDQKMAGCLAFAAAQQAAIPPGGDASARNNVYWFAVLTYKYGPTNALNYAKANTVPKNAAGKTEPQQVADIEALLAQALGLRTLL